MSFEKDILSRLLESFKFHPSLLSQTELSSFEGLEGHCKSYSLSGGSAHRITMEDFTFGYESFVFNSI